MTDNSASNLSLGSPVTVTSPLSRTVVIPQAQLPRAIASGNTHKATTQQPPKEPSWDTAIYDPIVVFTCILTLATLGLLGFTALLWRATVSLARDAQETGKTQADKMERSIAEAAKAAVAMEGVAASMAINAEQVIESVRMQRILGEKHLRAYIAVDLPERCIFQDSHLRFEARPRIYNSGVTGASDVKWKIAAEILPCPLPENFRYPLPEKTTGGSFVRSHHGGFMGAVVTERIPEDQVQDVKAGNGRMLTVWGYVSYRDIFGRQHRTTFAQQLRWEATGEKLENGSVPEAIAGMWLNKHNRSN